jgi:CHASE1-domain containing sensor protein
MLDRSETLSLFAMIAFMSLFAAGIAYEGALLQQPQKTAQLVVPNMDP